MDILIPTLTMALLGLVFGLGLAYALKIFSIKVDPTVALIISKLPGSNCGACGRAGCSGFAMALKAGEALPSNCALSSETARAELAKILGIEYSARVKTIATLLCNGGVNAKDKYEYRGIQNCKSSSLVFGGHKECRFGCLGLGDCVAACPFGAIRMGSLGLPEIDRDKCTSCRKCLEACPKNLFAVLPYAKIYYVKCSSTDPGAVTARACKSGCIACRKCEKACPKEAIKVESNLSKIDTKKCENMGKCFEVCPTKVIAKR
jgi:RnfABCDGE-type electron transport complex B subunit